MCLFIVQGVFPRWMLAQLIVVGQKLSPFNVPMSEYSCSLGGMPPTWSKGSPFVNSSSHLRCVYDVKAVQVTYNEGSNVIKMVTGGASRIRC